VTDADAPKAMQDRLKRLVVTETTRLADHLAHPTLKSAGG
jgi:hypothetical protein